MKLKMEVEQAMEDKALDYIDWEELFRGDKNSDLYDLKSGSLEAQAFREGFKHAIMYLSTKGHINSGQEEE